MECTWLLPELENTTSQPIGNHCYGLTSQNVSFVLPSNSEGLYEVPTGIIVLLSIFYGSISVIAVVGNFLVMWIIATTRRMHTVTHYFIANLALADIVIGLFSVPFQFQAALLQRWNLPHFMCPFCPFVQILSVNVSIFMLTAIALDRHRAVLNPLSGRLSKSRAKVAISSVWTLGVILAVPMAVALRVTNIVETDLVGRVHVRPFCQNVHFSHVTMMYYRFILFLLQYAVPLCIITCAYTRMAHRLWRSKAPGNAEDARDAAIMKNKKKVIKMLVIVVALFALCWLPLQTYNVLQELFPEINEYRYINIVWFCFDWLAMSNSCYNPFIYGIYNEKFRREFQKRFPALRSRHWQPAYSSESVDLDRTAQSPLPTKVSLRLLQFDVNNSCRNYDSEHYWQIHQVHSRSRITRKPVHHFKLSEFPRGNRKDYCDLRVNYKNDLSKRIECSKQVSIDSQFSSRLSSTNEEDDNDSGNEKTELTTFLERRNSERRDSKELFPV